MRAVIPHGLLVATIGISLDGVLPGNPELPEYFTALVV
jgi:hypothetical protein